MMYLAILITSLMAIKAQRTTVEDSCQQKLSFGTCKTETNAQMEMVILKQKSHIEELEEKYASLKKEYLNMLEHQVRVFTHQEDMDSDLGKRLDVVEKHLNITRCACSVNKAMDSRVGTTRLTDLFSCGSQVIFSCSEETEPTFVEPVYVQTCIDGKWLPDFEGDPWCLAYTKENPCEEFVKRDLCKEGSWCTIDGETSDAQCQCRPNFEGRFCDEPTDNYCSMIDCH
ncbi:unnamed protein product, partial [Owenia fusiformis]